MKPKLYALLCDALDEFFGRPDVEELLEDFYWGPNTVFMLADGMRLVWNSMEYADQMREKADE